MTDPQTPEIVGRRGLLGRSAALAAGTAAGAFALGAAGTRSAEADTGDALLSGRFNYAGSITRLTKRKAYSNQPTLELENTDDGPTLRLDPVTDEAKFEQGIVPEPGGFTTILERPVYAASDGNDSYRVGLATLDDIDVIRQPYVSSAYRILDTTKTYPGEVRDTSNFDSSGRLRAGRYVDLSFGPAFYDTATNRGVFLNVHSSGSTANGVLSVYVPGEAKLATLHYLKGVAVANFTVTPVAQGKDVDGNPTNYVRFYTSATTHLQVDYLGVIQDQVSSLPNAGLPHRIRRPKSAARRITSKLKAPR